MSIKGHENITHELTNDELWLANQIKEGLKRFTKTNPIKSPDLVRRINLNFGHKIKLSDVRLRKIVNYYRTEGILPVMSNSHGYYVSYDKKEIEDMILSLTQRANSIKNCCAGLTKIMYNL